MKIFINDDGDSRIVLFPSGRTGYDILIFESAHDDLILYKLPREIVEDVTTFDELDDIMDNNLGFKIFEDHIRYGQD